MNVINPKYEHLRYWIEALPERFSQEGEVIYDARNQIRVFNVNGLDICIKRYHAPAPINGLIYHYLRQPKAKRAYENGLILQERGITTPTPIAYILQYKHGLLTDSYLITETAYQQRLMREFTLSYTPELDKLITPFAQYTARIHSQDILPLDYSPGNILFADTDEPDFSIIDINRMAFKKVSLAEGMWSMRRMCARTYFFIQFAQQYAQSRGFSPDEAVRLILKYRDKFWNNGKKAQYEYI